MVAVGFGAVQKDSVVEERGSRSGVRSVVEKSLQARKPGPGSSNGGFLLTQQKKLPSLLSTAAVRRSGTMERCSVATVRYGGRRCGGTRDFAWMHGDASITIRPGLRRGCAAGKLAGRQAVRLCYPCRYCLYEKSLRPWPSSHINHSHSPSFIPTIARTTALQNSPVMDQVLEQLRDAVEGQIVCIQSHEP